MGLYRLFSTLALGLPVVHAAVPSIPGFTVTWSDDFVGTAGSLPNLGNWVVDTGTSYAGGPAQWGTWEVQAYTSRPENIRLSGDGNLLITALRSSSGQWTSGRIETQRANFVAQEGRKMRIQARVNMPSVANPIGYWPAFWSLGAAYRGNLWNWPSIGEFDIMENVNGIDRVWGVMHCGVSPGGPCFETDGRVNSRQCPGSPCQGNFHTYTLEVDRTQSLEAVRWFVDDQLYWQVVETDLPADVWAQAVHNPHFVLVNLAIGGDFPNKNSGTSTPYASTTSGGVLQVDYVAVYNS